MYEIVCRLKICRRLVPPQTPERVDPLVIAYLESEFAKLNSKNKLTVESLHGGKPWVADVNHWNFEAAKAATRVRLSSTLGRRDTERIWVRLFTNRNLISRERAARFL
jgi:hypothetical protein